jgi:hypothetical protein
MVWYAKQFLQGKHLSVDSGVGLLYSVGPARHFCLDEPDEVIRGSMHGRRANFLEALPDVRSSSIGGT